MIIDHRLDPGWLTYTVAHIRGGPYPKTVGLTSGCYDLFHNLHLTYLQRCRRHCDFLIVGIDSDDLVMASKGPGRPIIAEHQRIALVDALRCVDLTFIMGSIDDFRHMAQQAKPDFIFKNQNFRPQDVVGKQFCKQLVVIPDVFQADSTSGIIEEIKRARSKGAPCGKAPEPGSSTLSATPTFA